MLSLRLELNVNRRPSRNRFPAGKARIELVVHRGINGRLLESLVVIREDSRIGGVAVCVDVDLHPDLPLNM